MKCVSLCRLSQTIEVGKNLDSTAGEIQSLFSSYSKNVDDQKESKGILSIFVSCHYISYVVYIYCFDFRKKKKKYTCCCFPLFNFAESSNSSVSGIKTG